MAKGINEEFTPPTLKDIVLNYHLDRPQIIQNGVGNEYLIYPAQLVHIEPVFPMSDEYICGIMLQLRENPDESFSGLVSLVHRSETNSSYFLKDKPRTVEEPRCKEGEPDSNFLLKVSLSKSGNKSYDNIDITPNFRDIRGKRIDVCVDNPNRPGKIKLLSRPWVCKFVII